MAFQTLTMFTYFLQFLAFSAGYPDAKGAKPSHLGLCKPIPGDNSWPASWEWLKLNLYLSGRLISPLPPGGVCHPTQPSFNPVLCAKVTLQWRTNAFHAADPVSNTLNNWNNDTCLPLAGLPCSGGGYPVYVINATSKWDVKQGVDFAKRTDVRLIVKGTGHDYLGRSTAPHSLSIWTRHIGGLEFHEKGSFVPTFCSTSRVSTAAITVGAGVSMIEINLEASKRNLTVVSGGAATIGLGGYLSGGGHGAISPIFGLAADQVVEMEVVTPSGQIVTANACLNSDLFWAIRGGGGATFGIMTSVTIKAFPSFKYAVVTAMLATPASNTDAFFSAMAKLLSLFPSLADRGISAYTEMAPSYNASTYGIPFPVNGFLGTFQLPLLHPENTTASVLAAVNDTFSQATGGEGPDTQWYKSITGVESPDFYSYWETHNGPQNGGDEAIISSRLLDKKALTGDQEKLKTAITGAMKSGALTAHLVGGKGVHNTSQIPGGGNAVNPAWRKAYVHAILGVTFPPLDPAARERQHDLLTNNYTVPLRELAPDSGAYVNEADPSEPDYQRAFWGANYERLLKIKKSLDPTGVFWCVACVGGEDWKVDSAGRVCRIRF